MDKNNKSLKRIHGNKENTVPSEFQKFFNNWILKWEGGYVNHPNDPGGETKYGISKRRYPRLNIKDITKKQACYLYYKDYYTKFKCDEYEKPVSWLLCDMYINHSPPSVDRIIQKACRELIQPNLDVDGIMGMKTRMSMTKAIEAYGPMFFCTKLLFYRMYFYTRLKTFRHFGKGWIRRSINFSETFVKGDKINGNSNNSFRSNSNSPLTEGY